MNNKQTNSASRLYDILLKAYQQAENQQLIAIWGKVLGLESESPESSSFKVSEALLLIKNEIDIAETQMKLTEFSEALYTPYFTRCRKALSVTNLTAGWNGLRPNLKEDTMLCLQFCSEILPKDDALIEKEELEEFLQIVHELSEKLDNSSIPIALKEVIRKQLSIIYTAIHKYPISGTKSLREGLRAGMNTIVEEEIIIKENIDKEEVSDTLGLFSKFKKMGNGVIEADKIANATIKLVEKVNTGTTGLLEYFQ